MLMLIAAQGSGLVRGVHLLVDHCPDCNHSAHHVPSHCCDHEHGGEVERTCSVAHQIDHGSFAPEPDEAPGEHRAHGECPICQILAGLNSIVDPLIAVLASNASPRPVVHVPDRLPTSNSIQVHLGPRGPPIL
jgi:hypothetical protein